MTGQGITFSNGVLTIATDSLEKLTRREVLAARCQPKNIVKIDMSEARGLKSIEKMTFYKAERLEEVILPEGLEVIEDITFSNCTLLSKVTFPSTLKIIGSRAFKNCESLTEVILPEGLRHIESSAFRDCSRLRNVVVPSADTIIDKTAFSGSAWKEGTVGTIERPAPAEEKNQEPADSGSSIVITGGVLTASGNELRILDRDTLKKAGYSRYTVEKVDLSNCSNLRTIGERALYMASLLKEVILPPGLEVIEKSAFSSCESLSSINFPSSLKVIGRHAFLNCKRLETADIPAGTVIESMAFGGCPCKSVLDQKDKGTKQSNTQSDIKVRVVYRENKQPENKETTDAMTKTEEPVSNQQAFNLDENGWLTFNDSITVIPLDVNLLIKGRNAKVIDLSNLRNLSSLISSDNHTIGQWAQNVEKVILPESITKIDAGSFENCGNLTEVIMSDNVTEIGDKAFGCCRKLRDFKFPVSLKSIGEDAFTCCEGFTELSFPDSLESIGENAFSYCDKVKEITFGRSLNSIGENAFESCDRIKTVKFTCSVADIDENAFGVMPPEFETIYDYAIDFDCLKVNSWGEVERYRDQDPQQLKVVDLSGSNLKELPSNAFADCGNLEKVILPEGLKEISSSAFYGCHSLKSLEIPESVEVINCSFEECGIEELILPKRLRSLCTSGLKYIDMSHCEAIRVLNNDNFSIHEAEIVYLPPFLEKIGDYGCLSTIEYCFAPPTLKSIGGVNGVGFFCASPKIELSRDLNRSLLHVPEDNLDAIKAAAQKAGLRESRFKVLEMPYTFEYMYEK